MLLPGKRCHHKPLAGAWQVLHSFENCLRYIFQSLALIGKNGMFGEARLAQPTLAVDEFNR